MSRDAYFHQGMIDRLREYGLEKEASVLEKQGGISDYLPSVPTAAGGILGAGVGGALGSALSNEDEAVRNALLGALGGGALGAGAGYGIDKLMGAPSHDVPEMVKLLEKNPEIFKIMSPSQKKHLEDIGVNVDEIIHKKTGK